ncbi:MAG: patatin-like phospholipase family protein [Desulfovibrionaceae bacterium]|nr:patatin-like phospholipase family protein [Desulfovibrionaceae bacterium]
MDAKQAFGLAMGSGGARGLAHAGVLRALAARGLAPGWVAGTSIGAVIGALYCGGDLEGFVSWACGLTKRGALALVDPVFPRSGLLEGARIMARIKEFLRAERVEDCRPPLVIVAAEARTGKEALIRRGPLLDAVRAAISLPGILTPKTLGRTPMLDGALVNPLPVTACRVIGAKTVFAVDVSQNLVLGRRRRAPGRSSTAAEFFKTHAVNIVSALGPRLGPKQAVMAQLAAKWLEAGNRSEDLNIFEAILNAMSIAQRTVKGVRLVQDPPEALLAPDLSHIGFLDFHRCAEAVDIGRRAAEDWPRALS